MADSPLLTALAIAATPLCPSHTSVGNNTTIDVALTCIAATVPVRSALVTLQVKKKEPCLPSLPTSSSLTSPSLSFNDLDCNSQGEGQRRIEEG